MKKIIIWADCLSLCSSWGFFLQETQTVFVLFFFLIADFYLFSLIFLWTEYLTVVYDLIHCFHGYISHDLIICQLLHIPEWMIVWEHWQRASDITKSAAVLYFL